MQNPTRDIQRLVVVAARVAGASCVARGRATQRRLDPAPQPVGSAAGSTPRPRRNGARDRRSWSALGGVDPKHGREADLLPIAPPLEVRRVRQSPGVGQDSRPIRWFRGSAYSAGCAHRHDQEREVLSRHAQFGGWICSALAHDCRSYRPFVRNRVGGVYDLRGCRVPGLTRLVQGPQCVAWEARELRVLPGPLGRICACWHVPHSSLRGVVASRLRLDGSRCCLGRGFSVGSHVLAIHHGKEMSAVGLKNAVRGKR
jgi:hypothetical protein